LFIILFVVLFVLYLEIKTYFKFRKIIDVTTGKPIPIASVYFKSMYYLYRTRNDIPIADRLQYLSKNFGPFYSSVSISTAVSFTSPADVNTILRRLDDFPKINMVLQVEHIKLLVGGNNISQINNPDWHEYRKVLNKAFVYTTPFFQPMLKKANLLMEKWNTEKSEVYVGKDLQKFTLDVLATCIFGLEFDSLNGNLADPLIAYNYAIERVYNPLRIIFPLYNKLPLETNIRMKSSVQLFDRYIWEVMDQIKQKIEQRKNDGNTQPSSISIIELMYENNVPESLIRDNAAIFFAVGHDTTASNLGWIVATMASNPHVLEKARAEILEKIPEDFNMDHLKNLTYTEGLIKEVLRIYPVAPIIGWRSALKDTVVGNVYLPAGTHVQCDLISMSRDPKIWGDPEVIRPERWYTENLTKEQRAAWVPFSTGPRVCIGLSFTILEQKIFLIYLLKKFKSIKLAPNGEVKTKVGSFTYSADFNKFIVQFD